MNLIIGLVDDHSFLVFFQSWTIFSVMYKSKISKLICFLYIHRWGQAFRDAFSFRSSHYFVSYLSETSSQLSGLDIREVARPAYIEIPRSLVEVVVYWNMPMHYWLKTCKFFGFCLWKWVTTVIFLQHIFWFSLFQYYLTLHFFTSVGSSIWYPFSHTYLM